MIKNGPMPNRLKKALAGIFIIGLFLVGSDVKAATTIGANVSTDGWLKIGATVPGLPVNGMIYYDSGTNKFRCYENSAWTDCIGGVSGPLPVSQGGTGFSSFATGDLVYGNAGGTLSKLTIGSDGDFLTVSGGALTWQAYDPLVITNTFPVASQAAMLAAGALKGDVAIRSDESKSYICTTDPCNLIGNWAELVAPTNLALLKSNNLSDLTNFATARTNLGLGNVENTALSTWAGSTNITSVGTIGAGNWNGTTIAPAYGGTGLTSLGTGNQMLGVNAAGTALEYKTISGTSNRISVTNGAGTITLSGPQDIHTGATPQFGGLTLTGDATLNAQSDLRFADSDSSNWVAFQAPGSITSNITWTLPAADGTNGQVLTTDGTGGLSWTSAGGGGEVNTASNTGTVGTGIFKQKTGVDLEFYKINPASNKLSIALNGTDRVDLDVNEANLTLDNLGGTLGVSKGGTGQTTYTDGQLLIGNSTGNTLAKSTLTAGSGISITNGAGTITIAATGGPTSLTDNTTDAYDLQEGTNNYININTTDSSENISFGNATTNPSYAFLGSGGVTISSLGVGIVHSSAAGVLSSSAVNLASADVTGNLPDSNLATITTANKVSGSAVQLSANGGLTNNTGLSLLTTCANGQVLAWNSGTSSWVCSTSAASGVTSLNSLTGALTIANSSGAGSTITIDTADGITKGLLSAADWTTFNSKEPAITAGTTAQYWRGDKTWQTLDKTAVGLGNVENTALSTWAGSTNITTLGTVTTAAGNVSLWTNDAGYLTAETDPNAILKSIGTAKGDIIAFTASGTPANLASSGTNGQVLTVDTTTASGLKWATPSSGFSDPMTTRGDFIFRDATNTTTRLALGANGTVLKSDGTDAAWSTLSNTDVGLGNVENTALSTWAGSTNITTLGTVTTAAGNVSLWTNNAGYLTAETDPNAVLKATFTTNGDLLLGTGAGTYSRLGVGTNGQVLTVNGGVPSWQNAASGFTDPMTTRGDFIFRDATNTTTRLALGANGTVLKSDGTDAAWSTLSNTDVGLGNVENTALSTWAGSTNITTLGTITSGTWNGTALADAYVSDTLTVGSAGSVDAGALTLISTGTGLSSSSSGLQVTSGAIGLLQGCTDGQVLAWDETGGTWDCTTPTTGVTDHGALTGLGDDDHPQYGALAQNETITGNWVNTANPWAVDEGGTGLATFGGINTLLYTTAADTLASIATANNGVLITSAGGVPSIATTLPSAVQGNITAVGTITSGTWNGTAVDETHGGTNQTTYATGDILYASAANTLGKLTAGSDGQVLTLAAGVPTWSAAPAGSFAGLTTGTNTTATMTVGTGASITTSGSGTIAATSAPAGSLTGTTLAAGVTDSSLTSVGTITTGTWNGTTIDVGHGGTGVTTFGGINTLLYTTTADNLASITTANNGVLITSGTGAPSIATTLPTAVQGNITSVGTIGTGTWQGSIIGPTYGGTGQTTYTDGQLLIGNSTGNTLNKATLTAGTGINITNGSGTITIASTGISSSLADNTADALDIQEGTNNYININTTDSSENIALGNATTNPSFSFLGTGTTTMAGSLAVNGGTISSSAATLVLNAGGNVDIQDALNADSITSDAGLSIAAGNSYTGAGAVTLSSASGTALTINSGTTGALNIGDDASAETIGIGTGGAIKTLNIGTGTAGNAINIGTDNTLADTIVIGSALDSLTLSSANWSVTSAGLITTADDIAINGADITTTSTGTATVFNTNATTLNIGGAATTMNIGPTGSGASSIVLSGGSGDTGCTINGATGALTCTGNITSTAGSVGYWDRTGTTLSPSTSGDLISGNGGLTITGAAVSLNDSSNFATSINTGTSTGTVSIGNSSAGAISVTSGSTVSLTSGTTNAISLDSGTTGNVNIGNGNNAKTINIGSGTGGNTLNIGTGAGLDTINIGTGATGADVINIGSSNAGAISITSNAASTWQTTTGNLTVNAASASTLNLGTGSNAVSISATGKQTTINGLTDLGTATTDYVTFNGYVDSNIVPATSNTYTLGTSTLRWNKVYVGGNSLHIGADGDEATIGFDTTNNKLVLTATSGLNIASSTAPATPAAGDLYYDTGTNSLRWHNGSTWVTGGSNFTINGALLQPTTNTLGIQTTNAQPITSAGLLTASNGLTLSTGALNLTGTSGAIGLSGLTSTSIVNTGALTLTAGAASTWSTTSGALTITSAAAATWSTSAGNLTLQAGSGTVSLGTSTVLTSGGALTITSAGGNALTLDSDSGTLVLGAGTNTIANTDATTDITLNATGNIKIADPDLLVLGSKTDPDPTGVNGGMYYNTTNNKFRCYENSAWKDCDTTGSGSLPSGTVTNSTLRWDGAAWIENTNFLTTSAGTVSIAANQSYTGAGAVTLSSGAATTLTVDSGTTGAINIGTGANAKTITIGNSTGATALILDAGTGGVKIGDSTATAVTKHLSSTFTNVISNAIASRTCSTYATITFTGVTTADTVLGVPQSGVIAAANLGWNFYVSAADTVIIEACNSTTGTIDTADTETWRIDVWQH